MLFPSYNSLRTKALPHQGYLLYIHQRRSNLIYWRGTEGEEDEGGGRFFDTFFDFFPKHTKLRNPIRPARFITPLIIRFIHKTSIQSQFRILVVDSNTQYDLVI